MDENEDICGLCGLPGADKIPHPIHWPDERVPDTDLVHADCEAEECARASALCQGKARDDFLRGCAMTANASLEGCGAAGGASLSKRLLGTGPERNSDVE